jgi:recombination protein RecT
MTGQELATIVKGRIAELRDPLFEQQIALAVPEGVSPAKLLRAAATAVLDNPDLAQPHLRESLIKETLKCAQDGLLPDGRQAAFVIYAGKNPSIKYLPMIGGLRAIAAEYGWTLRTNVVYENDEFDYNEEPPTLRHRPVRPGGERGNLIAAWAIATHKDGRRLQRVLHPAEIAKRRANARTDEVWKKWTPQMWEKTAGHDLFDELPLDAKDRERVQRVLAATEITEDAAALLYGPEDRQAGSGVSSSRARVAEPAGEGMGGTPVSSSPVNEPIPDEADDGGGKPLEEPPFEGEEPVEGEKVEEPTFTAGKHQGRTLTEIYATGEEGVRYLVWAFRAWKQEPLRSALDAFSIEHSEIRGEKS